VKNDVNFYLNHIVATFLYTGAVYVHTTDAHKQYMYVPTIFGE